MKKSLKLTAIATVLTLATIALRADQTNLVQNLNIRLVGLTQGPSSTNRNSITITVDRVRIGTADVIAALGAATGNAFSSNALLVLITPQSFGWPKVAVQDGSTSVDVTSFFAVTPLSGEVTDYSANLRTGRYTSDSYSLEEFILQDTAGYPALSLHFDVRGITIDTFSNNPSPRSQNGGSEAHVTGLGDRQGVTLIVHGTISASRGTLQVVPGSAVPPGD